MPLSSIFLTLTQTSLLVANKTATAAGAVLQVDLDKMTLMDLPARPVVPKTLHMVAVVEPAVVLVLMTR